MITFQPTEELALFGKTARDFARQKIRPHLRASEREGIPASLRDEYLALGLAALELPEALGGLGQGLLGRCVVDAALAEGDLGITLALPAIGAGAEAVVCLGTEAQQSALIPSWVAAGKRTAVAWSEPRPKPGTFSTVARRVDGQYAINGKKDEVVLADEASGLVLFARVVEADGTSKPAAFVVEIDQPGVRVDGRTETLGLCAAPPVAMTFEDVRVSPDRMMAPADLSERTVHLFLRVGLVGAAREVGLARAAFDHARAYAAERTAFGKPIAHFQGLAFLLADMATRVEVMDGLVLRAAWAQDHQASDRASLAAAAIAECHEGAMWVANAAVQVLGGAGFVNDHPVEKWMRDAKAHMPFAMPHQLCDLLLGRCALEGGVLAMDQDAPMPGLSPVLM